MATRSAQRTTSPVVTVALMLAVAAFWLWQNWPAGVMDTAPVDLGDVRVSEPAGVAYDREGQFGAAWLDVDGNGCDTRNDILARDLTDIVLDANGCTILTGTLQDPYTGASIAFQRGVTTSSAVQVDHVVPLSYAIQHGADDWPQPRRVAFANDPANLIAVDGPSNSSKGDSGPADWMPANTAHHCEYVQAFLDVVGAYDLSVSHQDAQEIARVLESCERT